MIRTFVRNLAAAFAAASLAASPAALAQSFPPMPKVGTPKPFTVPAAETYTLRNGLQVTLIPYGLAPKATVSLRTAAGGLNEGNDIWLSQLVAEMMKEGAGGRSATEINEAAASMGGTLFVGSGRHETGVTISVLSDFTDEALALVADVARRPSFPSSELDRIKQNLTRTLAVQKSQPQPLANAALASAYYGDHPYGRFFPTEAQLAGYDLADVRRFHSDNFGARRSRLYIAGQFDAAAVKAAIERAFGDWEAGPERLRLPPNPRPGPQVILVDRPGAAQSTMRLAFPAPVAGDPADIPMRVSNALLGGSFNSRITRNIRENKGYTYSPGSGLTFNAGEAQWVFNADVTTDVTGPALKEVIHEIRRLQTEATPDTEAAGIRTYVSGIFVLQNASAGGLINSVATRDFHGLPTNWLDQYVPSVLAVTPANIQQLARERLPLERMTIVVVGDLAKVRPQLQALPELRGATFQTVTPGQS